MGSTSKITVLDDSFKELCVRVVDLVDPELGPITHSVVEADHTETGPLRFAQVLTWDRFKQGVGFILERPMRFTARVPGEYMRTMALLAKSWGAGKIGVTYLSPVKSGMGLTYGQAPEPVDPRIRYYLDTISRASKFVVSLWGHVPANQGTERAREIATLILNSPAPLMCLGWSTHGVGLEEIKRDQDFPGRYSRDTLIPYWSDLAYGDWSSLIPGSPDLESVWLREQKKVDERVLAPWESPLLEDRPRVG